MLVGYAKSVLRRDVDGVWLFEKDPCPEHIKVTIELHDGSENVAPGGGTEHHAKVNALLCSLLTLHILNGLKFPGDAYALGRTHEEVRVVFAQQFRSHFYAVHIFGAMARVLRYDPTGITVSQPFDWRANKGQHLGRFLERLCYASPRHEGIDESFGDLTVFPYEKLAAARASMNEFIYGVMDPIADNCPLRGVVVWDDSKVDAYGQPEKRVLIATYPRYEVKSYPGPHTATYIGYDIRTGRSYWVKDTWAIDRPGLCEMEGRTYAKLKAANVPHIPEVECAGFVCWSDGYLQRTRSHESYSNLDYGGFPRTHYRILFKDIGQPLTNFWDTHHLLSVVGQCIVGEQPFDSHGSPVC